MKNLTMIALMLTSFLSIAQKPIEGKGKRITKTFTLDPFHKIEIEFLGNVEVVCGAMAKVELTTNQNILDVLKVQSKNKTLFIGTDKWIENTYANLKITLPFLTHYTQSGWGNIQISNIDTDKFYLSASGGNLNLSGKVNEFFIESSGSGNTNTNELMAKKGTISRTGAGNLSVNVSDTLWVKQNHGTITYEGNPVVITGKDVDASYIMPQQELVKAKGELEYIKLKVRNNADTKKDFIIKGPKGHPFGYGFPMRANSTREETVPVGTRIWLETAGVRTTLLLTITKENEGKTIDLFQE